MRSLSTSSLFPFDRFSHTFQHRNKLIDDQNSELNFKKTLLSQKKSELLQIDDRIQELQERLAKKKQLNQQQAQAQAALQQQQQLHQQQQGKAPQSLSYSSLRSSIGRGLPGSSSSRKLLSLHARGAGSNVAAVEPMQRLHHSSSDQTQVSQRACERQVSPQPPACINNRAWVAWAAR